MNGAAERAARAALLQHCGGPGGRMKPKDGGLNNHVFEADAGDAPVIVRVADAAKRPVFEKEARAAKRARQAGVPAPQVLRVGEAEGWAYMIMPFAAGDMAVDHPRRLDILKALGALAAQIHSVGTQGHGPEFAWAEDPPDQSLPSWIDWLDETLQIGRRLALLRDEGLLTVSQHRALRAGLDDVRAWTGTPCLHHGDLRLKNVVVDSDGAITGLIDWEACVSSLGPHWDLSLALHDLAVDGKEAFLEGYGMPWPEVRVAAPAWRLFNIANYTPEVQAALDAGDAASLERIRTRLSGALDLYGSG